MEVGQACVVRCEVGVLSVRVEVPKHTALGGLCHAVAAMCMRDSTHTHTRIRAPFAAAAPG
eukprot:39084-Eustigmatos_ZCMA.PRE.1